MYGADAQSPKLSCGKTKRGCMLAHRLVEQSITAPTRDAGTDQEGSPIVGDVLSSILERFGKFIHYPRTQIHWVQISINKHLNP